MAGGGGEQVGRMKQDNAQEVLKDAKHIPAKKKKKKIQLQLASKSTMMG